VSVEEIITGQNEAAARGKLAMWTVFDRPRDHPEGFIARRFEVGGGIIPGSIVIAGELGEIRQLFRRAGLTCIARSADDAPAVLETWL
jgi:hypothetical protein